MSDGLADALIALCIERGDFLTPSTLGVTEAVLRHPCDKAWEYCIHVVRSGGAVSKDELKSRFGLSLMYSPDMSIEGLSRRLMDRAFLNDLRPIIEGSLGDVKEGDPYEAVAKLGEALRLRVKYSKKTVRPLSYKTAYEERIAHYLRVKSMKGLLGAPTRWDSLNRTIGGWQDGLFHVIAALSSVGKSWMLMLIVDDLIKQGRKPLIVSTEMAPVRLQFRLDCVRHKIPYPMFRDGTLTSDLEDMWMRTVFEDSEDSSSGDAIFIGKNEAKSVRDVVLYAKDLGVTDVIIDGAYRLAASREWGDQQRTVEEIQISAEETNVPWICTTQLGDSQESGKGFEKKIQNKWGTRYAKEWFIDPDVLLLLSQTKDMKLVKQMEIQVAKWRDGDGKPVSFMINWDVEKMNYDESTTVEEAEKSVEVVKELELMT